MWTLLLENAALILGIVISVYTVYSAIDGHLLRRRQRLVLVRSLRIKLRYLMLLASSFSALAKKTKDKHVPESKSLDAKLPEAASEDVQMVLLRSEHLLNFDIDWDAEKVAAALSSEQIESLLHFIEEYQTYKEVLTVRTRQLEKLPNFAGPLLRLSAVAAINLDDMKSAFNEFEVSFE